MEDEIEIKDNEIIDCREKIKKILKKREKVRNYPWPIELISKIEELELNYNRKILAENLGISVTTIANMLKKLSNHKKK